MHKAQIRTRTGSISDMHIHHCDCTHCDGVGELVDQFTYASSECPACEGMGYLEPASQEAYEAYLSDLYQEVVRTMPKASRPAAQIIQPARQMVKSAA